MSRRLLLVRHGRTALNAEGRLRGLADPDLDATGVAQARATAEALRPLGVDVVLASPLRRAQQTGRLIALVCDASFAVDERFTDRDYGPWTGEVKAEAVRRWGSVDAAPGVEAEAAVRDRARRALDELAAGGGETVAIVTHDAVIRPLLSALRPGIEPLVETGSWAELVAGPDGWELVSVDNAAE